MINLQRTTVMMIAATTVGAIAGWCARSFTSNGKEDSVVGATGSYREQLLDLRRQIHKQSDLLEKTDTVGLVHLGLRNINRELIAIGAMEEVMLLSEDVSGDQEVADRMNMSLSNWLDAQAQTLLDICNREITILEKD